MTTMIYENKFNKVIKRVLTFLLAFLLIGTISFASGDTTPDYLAGMTGDREVYQVISTIIGILSTAGFIIAIAKMMQIGIMFLIGSSAGKTKNEAKSALLPWIVGCMICATFGTLGPWVINLLMSGSPNDVFGI